MNLYISEIREFVRARIDELAAEESDMLLDEIDDRNLNTTIDKCVEEAITHIHLNAPASLMEGRILSEADLEDCVSLNSNVIDVDLSNSKISEEVLRLVSFKAGDSDIKLTSAVYEDSPQARMQLNPYVQGKPDDPVLVQMDDSPDFKPHYKYYTTDMTEKNLAFALRYFPRPKARTYSISLSVSRIRFGTDGGTKRIHVNTELAWKVTSVPAWLSVSQYQGNGSADITISADKNELTKENSTTLEFTTEQGSFFLEVEQVAMHVNTGDIGGGGGSVIGGGGSSESEESPFLKVLCASASNNVINLSPRGDFSLVQLKVYAKKRLKWNAVLSGNDASLFYVSSTSGVGAGSTSYDVVQVAARSANETSSVRTATLRFYAEGVSDQTFIIRQTPSVVINPLVSMIGAEGGNVSFSYTAGGSWTVSQITQVDGVRFTDGYVAGSAGSGTINVFIPENTDALSRTIRMKIECLGVSKDFSVMQSGATVLKKDESVQFVDTSKTYAKSAGTYTVDLVCSDGLEANRVVFYASPSGWINNASVEKTSATTMRMTFSLSENTGNERQSTLYVGVSSKEEKSTLVITQSQGVATSFKVVPESGMAYVCPMSGHSQNIEVTSPSTWKVEIDSTESSRAYLYYNGKSYRSLELPAGKYAFELVLGTVSSEASTVLHFNKGVYPYMTFVQQASGTNNKSYITGTSLSVELDAGAGSTGRTGLIQTNLTSWEIRNLPSWVTATKKSSGGSTYVEFTALKTNLDSSDWTGTATLYGSKEVSATVVLTQNCATIDCPSMVNLSKDGTEKSIVVKPSHGYAWELKSMTSSWLSVMKKSSSLVFSASENTSYDARTEMVTIALTNYPEVTRTIKVTQASADAPVVVDSITLGDNSDKYITCAPKEMENGVGSSADWLVDTETLPDWMSVRYYVNDSSLSRTTLKISVSRNEQAVEREGKVRVYLAHNPSVYDEMKITQGAAVSIHIQKDGITHKDVYVDSQDARAYEDSFNVITSPKDLVWSMTKPATGMSISTLAGAGTVGDVAVQFSVVANSSFSSEKTYSVLLKAYDKKLTDEVIDEVEFKFVQGMGYFEFNQKEVIVTNDAGDIASLSSSDAWEIMTDIYHMPFTVTPTSGDPNDFTAPVNLKFEPKEGELSVNDVGTYTLSFRQKNNGKITSIKVQRRVSMEDAVYISVSNKGPIRFTYDPNNENQVSKIYIRANVAWTGSVSADWVHINAAGGAANELVELQIRPVLTKEDKHATYTINANGKLQVIDIFESKTKVVNSGELTEYEEEIIDGNNDYKDLSAGGPENRG